MLHHRILTVRPLKMVVGRRSAFPIGKGNFSGAMLNFGVVDFRSLPPQKNCHPKNHPNRGQASPQLSVHRQATILMRQPQRLVTFKNHRKMVGKPLGWWYP